MRAVFLIALGLTAVTAVPTKQSVIVGGSLAVISQYPSIAGLLYSTKADNFNQACVGTIITTKSILTAAHCVYGDTAYRWRARVGSSWANSGGTVHALISIIIHPSFKISSMDYDIAILKSNVVFSNAIKPASIASANYNLADNQVVWTAGWGAPVAGAAKTEQLRHIQASTINQYTCAARYGVFGANVTANMLCTGWLTIGGRDQCQGDSGNPVYHNTVLVGISSWGYGCANAIYPGVSTRISRLTPWIQANA